MSTSTKPAAPESTNGYGTRRAEIRARDLTVADYADAIDPAAIRALQTEAGNAGDEEQVAICERALSGDESAIRECGRVIREAAAQS